MSIKKPPVPGPRNLQGPEVPVPVSGRPFAPFRKPGITLIRTSVVVLEGVKVFGFERALVVDIRDTVEVIIELGASVFVSLRQATLFTPRARFT